MHVFVDSNERLPSSHWGLYVFRNNVWWALPYLSWEIATENGRTLWLLSHCWWSRNNWALLLQLSPMFSSKESLCTSFQLTKRTSLKWLVLTGHDLGSRQEGDKGVLRSRLRSSPLKFSTSANLPFDSWNWLLISQYMCPIWGQAFLLQAITRCTSLV